MKVRLLHPAQRELEEALDWYSQISPELEARFLFEVDRARLRIIDFPYAWHPLGDGVRRCRLDRFPYGLIYLVDGDDIAVVAVAHLSRKPDYWRDRLPK
jgi:plasmid stabilization system protein ParE